MLIGLVPLAVLGVAVVVGMATLRLRDVALRTESMRHLKALGDLVQPHWAAVAEADDPLAALEAMGVLTAEQSRRAGIDPWSGKQWRVVPEAGGARAGLETAVDVDRPILISGLACSLVDRWLGRDVGDCEAAGGILFAGGHAEHLPRDRYCAVVGRYDLACGER